MAEAPGTSSETVTETVLSSAPPPQQVSVAGGSLQRGGLAGNG